MYNNILIQINTFDDKIFGGIFDDLMAYFGRKHLTNHCISHIFLKDIDENDVQTIYDILNSYNIYFLLIVSDKPIDVDKPIIVNS